MVLLDREGILGSVRQQLITNFNSHNVLSGWNIAYGITNSQGLFATMVSGIFTAIINVVNKLVPLVVEWTIFETYRKVFVRLEILV